MEDPEWQGAFTFVQAADTQLGFMADPTWATNPADAAKDGNDWSDEIELARRLVACCNALVPRPKFVAVCGDLVHALPEGVLSDQPAVRRYANEGRWRRQNEDFKRVMADLEMPLVCVCGNHDVGDRPTPASLAKYRGLYGADRRAFWCGGMRALVLNSQLMNDPVDAPDEAAAQDEWFGGELDALAASAAKHAVLFQHIPWFLKNESEPRQGYFNLSGELRLKWLERMKRAGIKTVFCGHYHRNATSRTDDGALEVVVTSAVGRQMSPSEVAANAADTTDGKPGSTSEFKSGMRLVHVDETTIRHTYHDFDELEASSVSSRTAS